MDRPDLAIVIPALNEARTIGRVIEMARNHGTVFVVDDGSTDDTEVAMEQYRDRVNYIKKANGGVSNARNVGISASTGDWVAFLDSDDLWRPTKLEVQIRDLQRHPTAIAHFTNALIDRDFIAKDELFTLRGGTVDQRQQ